METRPNPPKENRHLLPIFDRVEPVILSHSMMDEYKKCPRKFFYSTVLGYKPKFTPPYFVFGSAYHKFRELLTLGHKEAKSYKDPEIYKQALIGSINLFKSKLPKGPPPGKWFHLDLARLLQSCELAYQTWLKERESGLIEVIECELPFNLSYAGNNRTNGRFDELISWNKQLYIRDYKTSSKPKNWFEPGTEPNDQVSRYIKALSSLTNEPVRGVVFDVMLTDSKKKPEIYSVITSRTRSQLDRWEKDQEFLHAMIDASREHDVYPMYEPSCNFCDYHIVCKSPNTDSMAYKLRSEFKFEPYDNMARD